MNIDLAGFPSDNPMPSFCSGIIPGLVKFQQRYVKSHTVFSRSCKVLCTPLFVKDNTASFDACTKACEDCKSCGGTPSLNGTLVCAGAAPCRGAGGKLTCCQGGAPCCGGVCCQAGEDCCEGMCLPGCVAGTVRDPQTCVCASVGGGPNLVRCFCADGSLIEVCAVVICDSGPDQDRVCGPICAPHGGESATGCLDNHPICAGT
jgi:hypothetical protein